MKTRHLAHGTFGAWTSMFLTNSIGNSDAESVLWRLVDDTLYI